MSANSLLRDVPSSGFFQINPPYWIDGYDNKNYKVLGKSSDCSSSQFTVDLRATQFNGGFYRIGYSDLLSTVASTGITIECTNFRNPTYQQTTESYEIKSRKEVGYRTDYDIVTFPTFTLDATGLQKQELTKEISVQFYSTDEVEQTSGVQIQTRSRIKFSFNTPFPIASGGCYLEVKFPKQFPLTDEAYTYIPE